MNTFTDFIDCAEALAREGWCDPKAMASFSMSAGGALVMAVANMRPDLFRAVIAEYPWTEPLNSCYDTTLDRIAAIYDIADLGDPAKDPAIYRSIGRNSMTG